MNETNIWHWATLSNGWKAIVAQIDGTTVKVFCLTEWIPTDSRPTEGLFAIAYGKPEIVARSSEVADFNYSSRSEPVYDEPILRNIVGYMYYQTAKIDGLIYEDEKFVALEKPMPSAF